MKKRLLSLFVITCSIHVNAQYQTKTQVATIVNAAIAPLTKTISNQGTVITRLIADTVLKSKKITDLILKTTTQDGYISQAKIDIANLKSQLSIARSTIDSLQQQADDVQDIAVHALLDANKKDSLSGAPGQILITQPTQGNYQLNLSPDFLKQISAIQAKLPK